MLMIMKSGSRRGGAGDGVRVARGRIPADPGGPENPGVRWGSRAGSGPSGVGFAPVRRPGDAFRHERP